MAVVLYSGLQGSGKSYGVVENVLIPAAREGRAIYTNVRLSEAFAVEFPGVVVLGLPNEPAEWLQLAPGSLVVVDEAWRYWPSGNVASKIPEQEREFFAMHRHRVDELGRSQQVCLVTQQADQLAKFVRGLVEIHFRAVKLTALGAPSRFRIDVYEGVEMLEGKRIRQMFGSYSAEVWRFYQSHTARMEGSDGVAIDERMVDKRATIWGRASIRYGAPLLLLVVVVAVWKVLGFFDLGSGAHAGETNSPPVTLASASQAVVTGGGSVGGGWSSRWRLAGVVASVEDPTRALFVAVDGQGRERVLGARLCSQDEAGEWVCSVDGEKVSFFSGMQTAAPTMFGAQVVKGAPGAGQASGTATTPAEKSDKPVEKVSEKPKESASLVGMQQWR